MRPALGAILLLVGCVGSPASAPMAVDALEGEGLQFAPAVSTGIPVQPLLTDVLDGFAGGFSFEPFIVADGVGRIFVADGRGSLAVSIDEGRTFVPLAGPFHEGVRRSGDVALAVTADDALWYAQSFNTAGSEGRGLHVAVSRDGGRTWPVNEVFPADGQDRPWWVVGQDRVFLTWTRIDGERAVFAQETRDGGRSFEPAIRLPSLLLGQGAVARDDSILAPDCAGLVDPDDHTPWHFQGLRVACAQSIPMLARAGPDELSVVFDDDAGAIAVATSPDDGDTWTSVVRVSGTDEIVLRGDHPPGPWLVTYRDWRAVAYYAEGEEGTVDLVVARLVAGTAHRGIVDAGIGAQNADDRPANTDFAALTVLPDGRLVAAWAPALGDIMVRVEASAPKLS